MVGYLAARSFSMSLQLGFSVSSTLKLRTFGFLKCLSLSSFDGTSSSLDSYFRSRFFVADFSLSSGRALLSNHQTNPFFSLTSISLLSSNAFNRTFLSVVRVFILLPLSKNYASIHPSLASLIVL